MNIMNIVRHIVVACLFVSICSCSCNSSSSSSNSRNSIDGEYSLSVATGNVHLSIYGDSWVSTIDGLNGRSYSSGSISDGILYKDPSGPFEQRMAMGSIKGNTVYFLNHKMTKR